ncbi:hypothetical protein PYW08_008300 [Mythimna loreyi]|uniref:Uncharacterized protein n=1 Tax=Mythimna loreyi TaxID=667449 RepID=A0ACC2QB56_9NEOP|nr:hypothetical protein PYW08_008300 [Mythimna loreyi]
MRALMCLVFSIIAKTGEGTDDKDFDYFESLSKKRNEYPSVYNEPVPFGHITREGFGDPFSPIKPPGDNLELLFKTPKDQQEAIEYLEKTKRTNLIFLNPELPKFFGRPDPKEELVLERYLNPVPEQNDTVKLKWYDLPTIQARNAMLPPKKQYIARKRPRPGPVPMMPPSMAKMSSFAKGSFGLATDRPEMRVNWTTCDEFVVGAVFSPKDIVNLKWTPFYVWESDVQIDIATEHTFEYPSNKLVNEYHARYNKMVNKTIDWTKAKLLMKGIAEALLIAADKRGLFHVLGKHDVPDGSSDILLPSLTLRMKIEDPYLAMTYCERHFATLMAVSGNEPTDYKEMKVEADTIKFKGTGRPIWRDYVVEKESAKSIQEAKLRAEKDKVIVVNDPLPPIACVVSAKKKKLKFKYGPSGMSFDDSTNCTEFSKFGRFNPFSVLHETWFVFYYWAADRPLTTFVFTAPSANHTRRLKKLLDGNCILPVMWNVRQVLVEDNEGYISLLVERSDRGEYWLYPVARVKPGQKITPRDVRLKQTGDNRILGLMDCAEESLLVMARINDVPRQGDLHAEASRLGYRGRRGRSYLYQGHEWGPVGEADENMFWDRRERKDSKDNTSKENKSSEENSDEVELLPTNEPEEKKKKAKKNKEILPPIVENKDQCVKVLPELWNDPKPNPNPDNLRITKEELNNLDSNNTLTIDVINNSPNNQQENDLVTKPEPAQDNDKLDKQQEQEPKPEMPLNEPKDLESPIEFEDPDKQDCVVCYKSKINYMPEYIPDKIDLTNDLKNNEDEPTTEVPVTEIPYDKVSRKELSQAEALSASKDVPRVEVLNTEFLSTVVPVSEMPVSEELKKPSRLEVPRVELRSTEVPRAEITIDKGPHVKLPAQPSAPEQDLTNSSQIIILTPKTLD